MTIRKKIFLLASVLLALFGVVVGALAIIQKLDSDQIGNIVRYELPLSRMVAYCVAPHHRLIGTGFGIFPKSEAGNGQMRWQQVEVGGNLVGHLPPA